MSVSNVRSNRTPQGSFGGKYPFSDNATLTSQEGYVLSPSFLADASLYPMGGGHQQFVSRIQVQHGSMTVTIADDSGDLASGTCALGKDSELLLLDKYGRPAGVLLGMQGYDPGLFQEIPDGTYTFDQDATVFVPTCVIPQPQDIAEGFLMADGSYVSGEVWLVGKNGVVLEVKSTDNTIQVHLVGDPWFKRRQCVEATVSYTPPSPLKQIKLVMDDQADQFINVVPDGNGNVFLTTGNNQATDNVLRIEPVQYGLKIYAIGTTRGVTP